jgi:hypothetical protein
MTILFVSAVCDWCDGLKQSKASDTGYVVFEPFSGTGSVDLEVFPSPDQAMYYQRTLRIPGEIRKVITDAPIRWQSADTAMPGLIVADVRFKIYADSKFEPGPYKAYLSEDRELEFENHVTN